MNELDSLVESATQLFAQSATPADLENAKAQFLGKSGRVTELMKGMAQLSVEEKKSRGAAINVAKQAIEAALTARRQALADAELQLQLKAEALDVSLPGRQRGQGGLHPVSLTLERIQGIFGSMGFDVAEGPEIETDWFNFTALNTPEDHPARSMHDTFYVEGGTATAPNLLRTHTSPMQIRHAVQHVKKHRAALDAGQAMPEIRVIAPGRTYRVDSDATHSPMFHQCEGLWIGENVSFKDLKVIFTDFCRTFFESDDLVLRFRPSFFPFTEPSAEMDISCNICGGKGCNFCKHTGWVEILGCGMVDPHDLEACGIDSNVYTGYAFGMGVERITNLKYRVSDLRLFSENDTRFLREFESAK